MFSTLRFILTHPLSSKRPLSALWRYGRWQMESRLTNEVEFSWVDGSKLIARNGMTGATGNIYCGLHEFTEMAFLLHFLHPNELFVDAGANIGSYTILSSAVCRAHTLAIEPDPASIQALSRNIEANNLQERVDVRQVALGAREGRILFTVDKDTMNRAATSSDSCTQEVALQSLDSMLKNLAPVLIKMDVEGYEAEVIQGAQETLRRPSLLALQLETVDASVRECLKCHGFEEAH